MGGGHEKTDDDLVAESKKGDERAFAELVKRHREKAVELAYLAVGNYEDARDLSQEAFVKVYHSLKRFEMRAKFSTWFYRILMNTAKDFLRKKQWKQFLTWKTHEEMEDFFEKVHQPGVSPVKDLMREELQHQMTGALVKLPLKQRWIFTLRFLEGLSIREIGEATNLSEGTVKAALHFGIQKFKNHIAPYVKEGGFSHGF